MRGIEKIMGPNAAGPCSSTFRVSASESANGPKRLGLEAQGQSWPWNLPVSLTLLWAGPSLAPCCRGSRHWLFPCGSWSPRLAGPFDPPCGSFSFSSPFQPYLPLLCACATLSPFRPSVSHVDTRPSYLFPFRSFGSRPPPGSRMPLQTKVR